MLDLDALADLDRLLGQTPVETMPVRPDAAPREISTPRCPHLAAHEAA